MTKHIPVLLNEVLENIKHKTEGVFIDATLGGGGHSLKILDQIKNGALVCFDVDKKNIINFKARLELEGYKFSVNDRIFEAEKNSKRIILINDNFKKLNEYIEKLDIGKATVILADLGWSSDQLMQIKGLSYKNPEDELDMRLSEDLTVKASDLLNALDKQKLELLFERYADIRGRENKKLVDQILKQRTKGGIKLVNDLLQIIYFAFSAGGNKGKRVLYSGNLHAGERPENLSKVFQALRIAVNLEYEALDQFTKASIEALERDGLFLVITFHSGEEKLLKNVMQSYKTAESVKYVINNSYGNFIRPSVEELKNNLSARSAKLFVFKKL